MSRKEIKKKLDQYVSNLCHMAVMQNLIPILENSICLYN